jgi:hypothetical protein
VEVGGPDVQSGHLGIGNLDALLIGRAVKTTLDREAFVGLGGGDQLDDDLVRQKRMADFGTTTLGSIWLAFC